ncbi:hypothetical protein ACLBWT_05600 [Paenibacillus sp. D51F]
MQISKKTFISIFLILSILSSFIPAFGKEVLAAPGEGNPSIVPARDINNPNSVFRYAVGFMYMDIWSNSAGQWTTYKPNDEVTFDAPYTFSFPGRTVKDVTIRKFNSSSQADIDYFNASRPTEDGQYQSYECYVGQTIGSPQVVSGSKTGIDTSTVNFKAQITGKLSSSVIFELECPNCSSNVHGYRYKLQRSK